MKKIKNKCKNEEAVKYALFAVSMRKIKHFDINIVISDTQLAYYIAGFLGIEFNVAKKAVNDALEPMNVNSRVSDKTYKGGLK